ncbi:hypothetical protein L3Y34_008204 [Caenorhabditis briggsae]|uniref:Uncharacterized protein n=1 Tax=Caenorhabditis briggsae TaxID=6238 RepID=A0AAE9A8V3_CAEBR|nr:hypothetical protein L3Y34_008204 [Caenorhabditis briggsae]
MEDESERETDKRPVPRDCSSEGDRRQPDVRQRATEGDGLFNRFSSPAHDRVVVKMARSPFLNAKVKKKKKSVCLEGKQ